MDSFLHDISWVVPLRSPVLTTIFEGFTLLGYTEFFLLFLPLGYWLWDKAMFTRMAVLIGLIGLSNTFLKDLFHDPRPLAEFALDKRVGESFGFPSGHAQVATAMWLWLAYEIRRPWAWAAAFVILLGVALSRIYLGVHDVEDVIAGVLLGFAAVIIYAAVIKEEYDFWHTLNPELQLLAIAALVPIIWIAWPATIIPAGAFALVAFIFFWWLGYIIEQRWIHYERHESMLFAGVAAFAGLVVLFAIMKLTGDVLDAAEAPKALTMSLQFAAVSLYVTALAPAIFRASRLAW